MAKTEVEEVLGAPINPELSEYAQKLRRNLLAFGSVYVFCWLTGVKLDPTSAFFGIKLIGLNEQQFSLGTMIINAYLFVHFGWYAWEAVLEWRVRITGTRVAFQTSSTYGAPSAGDYPRDPRQSTLYNWWLRLAKAIDPNRSAINDFEERIKRVEAELKGLNKNALNVDSSSLLSSLAPLPDGLRQIRAYMERIDDALKSGRIEESLKRYDEWFKLMLRSQNLRMISIDIALPLFIGITATAMNAYGLVCQ